MKTLAEIHNECGSIIKSRLLESPNGRSFACEIWDKMTCNEANCDNCIGENFNQLIQGLISEWFDSYSPLGGRRDFYVNTYMFHLYLFYERIEFIFNEIDPEGKFPLIQQYRKKLKTLDEIRLWANFIKHPKHFSYVHWPQYVFVGDGFHKEENTLLVNTAFLREHYSSEKQAKPRELENNSSVVVQYPKLETLTNGFCDDFLAFIRFVCDNNMISDHLKAKSNKPFKWVNDLNDN